jgi:hypothetical protein
MNIRYSGGGTALVGGFRVWLTAYHVDVFVEHSAGNTI